MKRYFMIGLALVMLLALSTITVAAEDMIYYGSGDGDNTGNFPPQEKGWPTATIHVPAVPTITR